MEKEKLIEIFNNRRVFNANKRHIIEELETVLHKLKLNCENPSSLRYIANNYLKLAIEDLQKFIKEAENDK